MRLILFCWALLSALAARGYDTLCLTTEFSKKNLLSYSRTVASNSEDPTLAWREVVTQGAILKSSAQGFSKKIFWTSFTLKNCSDRIHDALLELDNPQIDVFTIYEVSPDEMINFILETGDRFPFSQRMMENRNFLVPVKLNPGEAKTYLLKIDKRYSSVSFPLYVWERVAHREKDYRQNLGFGLFFGFMLLCLVYSIFTFVFLRTKIYWWYTWWIVFSGLFSLTALGFSHQYLYPQAVDFNSKFRVYIEIVSLISILKFLNLFLKVEFYFPRLVRYVNVVIYLLFGMLLITPFLKVYDPFVAIALPLINITIVLGVLLIIYAAIKSYAFQKQTVLFFFAAFGAIIIATGIIIMTEFGYLSQEDIPVNPYLLGSGIEIFLFSLGLTFQIKKVYEERNELSSRISRHQKEMMQAYVEGVEKERSRIAGELHDDIGSRLGNLRRIVGGLQHEQKEYIEQQVEKLSSDVRLLSHQLAPSVSRKGLAQAAKELILDFQKGATTQFSLQCYDVPDQLPDVIYQQCYRMLQEILNNIIKHANATTADIQLFGHEGELVMTIEDDGVGFEAFTVKKNLGLQQLQVRAESMQGILEISSSPGMGTQIMIRIPLSTTNT